MTTTQPTPDQQTSPLPTTQPPLVDIHIPDTVKKCLNQAYTLYLAANYPITDDINVLFNLATDEHFKNDWLAFCETYPSDTIYKAFIIDFYRIRQPHPEKFGIRRFRAEWYATINSLETAPRVGWKVFAQKVGAFYSCPFVIKKGKKKDLTCKFSSYTNDQLCPKHHLELQYSLDIENEYKKLNKALSNLVEQNVVTYIDLRLMNVALDKNPIRATMTTFKKEKGYKNIILCLEKAEMFTKEVIETAERYGLIVLAASGEPSRLVNETLYQILRGELCLKCLITKEELARKPYTRCDKSWSHDFYDHTEPLTILVISDYDPAGFHITNSFHNHFSTYEHINFKRIGLTKEQIEAENPPEFKFFELPPAYQDWEHGFTINEKKYGVEMDIIEWKTYAQAIVDALIDMLGAEPWTEYAKEQSAETYDSNRENTIHETASNWIEKCHPLYPMLLHQINEYNTFLAQLKEQTKKIEEKRHLLIDQLAKSMDNHLTDSALEAQDDFDEREPITNDIISAILHESSFEIATETYLGKTSVLHNDLLLEKISNFLDDEKDDIIDDFLEEYGEYLHEEEEDD